LNERRAADVVTLALVMHAPLGSAFADCAAHVLGHKPDLIVFDVQPDDPPDEASLRLNGLLESQGGNGVLILCDIYGATPFNIASRVLAGVRARGKTAELLAGANLCMLLKALTTERPTFEAMVASVRDGGQRGIVRVDAPSISFHDRGSDSLID